MENVIASSNETTLSILGDTNQVLQIILKPDSSVMINTKYLVYASSPSLEEVPYHEVNSLLPFNEFIHLKFKKYKNNQLVRLKNISTGFEYLGVSKGGKIMKINPFFYHNLYVRIDSLLAFSFLVDLCEDSEYSKIINTHFKTINMRLGKTPYLCDYAMICPKGKKDSRGELIDKVSNSNKNGESGKIAFDIASINNDYLYLSSDKIMIEKRLGEHEQIVVMKYGLIAFEKSVTFFEVNTNNKTHYFNSNEDIIVEGPGLIIFESVERKGKDRKGLWLALVSLVLVCLEIIIPLLI